jgi:alkylated DNA repair dioxygenase AlkB
VLSFQGSLLGGRDAGALDTPVERVHLANDAWLDHAPNWLPGADDLFVHLVDTLPWRQGRRPMYGREVDDPRLTVGVDADAFADHPPLDDVARALGERYRATFPSCWMNLYRDGRDSVAWHGDRVARDRPEALVALVSLGERRPFLLRPKGGGRSIRHALGQGDLLVMGGTCQRTWDHSVPKVAHAGPRLSVTFRPEGQTFQPR